MSKIFTIPRLPVRAARPYNILNAAMDLKEAKLRLETRLRRGKGRSHPDYVLDDLPKKAELESNSIGLAHLSYISGRTVSTKHLRDYYYVEFLFKLPLELNKLTFFPLSQQLYVVRLLNQDIVTIIRSEHFRNNTGILPEHKMHFWQIGDNYYFEVPEYIVKWSTDTLDSWQTFRKVPAVTKNKHDIDFQNYVTTYYYFNQLPSVIEFNSIKRLARIAEDEVKSDFTKETAILANTDIGISSQTPQLNEVNDDLLNKFLEEIKEIPLSPCMSLNSECIDMLNDISSSINDS
jgi:hypothetical protein